MAFSMAGLASTMQGADMATRQRQADTIAANNAARDQLKFDQEKKASDEQSRSDDIINGKVQSGLSSAPAKTATNGSRIIDSVKGLFGISAPEPEAQPSPLNPAQQLEATKGQSGLAQTAPEAVAASVPQLQHKLAQDRLNAYAAKNPNDINTINATQAKIDSMAKLHRTGLAQRAYEDLSIGRNPSALTDLYNEHIHDGKTASEARYVDEKTVAFKMSDGTIIQKPMENIKDFLLQLQKPGSAADAYLQKLTEQAKAEGKLPSELSLETTKGDQTRKTENNKIDGEIRKDKETGQVGLRTAQANSANASAAENSASAGGKKFDNQQKADLAKAKAELDAVNQQAEPSKYKQLQQKVARLTPVQTNAGGLHTSISETEDGKKVPIITDPMTGKVYQGGNLIYQRGDGLGSAAPQPALPKNAPQVPTGFKPL